MRIVVRRHDTDDKRYTYTVDPELDYRDDSTVWIRVSKNTVVELSRNLVQQIMEGFEEQEKDAQAYANLTG